jgi:hypothetical protein
MQSYDSADKSRSNGGSTFSMFAYADSIERLVARHIFSLRRMNPTKRAPQVCVLGSAEPGSEAYELAGAAGEMVARVG